MSHSRDFSSIYLRAKPLVYGIPRHLSRKRSPYTRGFVMGTRVTLTCPQCGGEFQVKPSHADKRTYCSRDCMSEAYKTRLQGDNNPNFSNAGEKICQTCGKTYYSYNKTRKYCSWQCAGLAQPQEKLERMAKMPRKSRKRRTSFLCTCKRCGKEFRWKHKKKILCPECNKAYHTRPLQTCTICGKKFRHKVTKKTCSIACENVLKSYRQQGAKSHRWQGGKTSKLRRLRNSTTYQEWRTAVFERDDYTCQLCGQRGGRLTAHHIKMVSEYKELMLVLPNGITLCRPCHADIRGQEHDYEDQFFTITGGL